MDDTVNDGKRDFLKGAAVLGVASSMITAAAAPRDALAQMLETGIREDSSLAKVRKEGVMRVGYSQTGPWFYKDAKSGELGGIYKDAVDRLAKKMEVKVDYKEVTFQNSTVGLRRNDYDLYGSSLTYKLARALVVDPAQPIYKRPNTCAVRYGDSEWKHFLDFFAVFLTVNGEMERLFKLHMEKLGAA